MAILILPPEYPGIGYDRSITFAGVLQKEFYKTDFTGSNIGLSRKWNDRTAEQYCHDYLDRLLPTITKLYGAEKPMHTYIESDFEEILKELGKRHHYAERTIMHYRYLLWIVYRAGFESGLYEDNIFWDELIDPVENPEQFEKQRATALTRIRKSFSVEEDIRLMHWFKNLNPATASGSDVALACMYFLGCRNNEACGANFSAFHPLHSYPQTAVFDMVQTTVVGSNQLKSSGKSSNAPRTIPVPSVLYEFILRRRAFIENQLKKGLLILPAGINSADQLPIACVGNHYATRMQTGDLSRAGRALFQEIGINKSELAVLHQIMFSEEFQQTQVIEKDPTTYLFRRNVATRLYHLGFEWKEIQYWIAHEIEDTLTMRNFFADEDILHELGLRYEKHPVFNIIVNAKNCNPERYRLSSSDALYLTASADEPGQQIVIEVSSTESPVQISLMEYPSRTACSSSVSILNSLYRAYQTTYKKLSE